jgi:hypothetical protein
MAKRNFYHMIRRNPQMRLCLFTLGAFLIILSPIIGILPGPGGLILFPIGLTLCLQNSQWAKRRYARLKARFPKYGNWADKVMRRTSAARRRAKKRLESLTDDD